MSSQNQFIFHRFVLFSFFYYLNFLHYLTKLIICYGQKMSKIYAKNMFESFRQYITIVQQDYVISWRSLFFLHSIFTLKVFQSGHNALSRLIFIYFFFFKFDLLIHIYCYYDTILCGRLSWKMPRWESMPKINVIYMCNLIIGHEVVYFWLFLTQFWQIVLDLCFVLIHIDRILSKQLLLKFYNIEFHVENKGNFYKILIVLILEKITIFFL